MIYSAKKVLGMNFRPPMTEDKRGRGFCLYFPNIIAKHYVKLGINRINKNKFGVPKYVKDSYEFSRVWLQATISEDGSIYPFINKIGDSTFLYPRLQINRTIPVRVRINSKAGINLYIRDLPRRLSYLLNPKRHKLLIDEAKLFSRFDLNLYPRFMKLRIHLNGNVTAPIQYQLS